MKRRLLKLGLLLLLGAIINVAVAWGCVWRSQDPRDWKRVQWKRPWPVSVPEDWLTPTEAFEVAHQSIKVTCVYGWMSSHHEVLLFEGGFPCRSFAWHTLLHGSLVGFGLTNFATTGSVWNDGINAGELSSDPKWPVWKRLPVRPIWPGFAINTLFYAAIVWLLFFAPFKLRRWRRIRRGLCPACAYPVGTSDNCTECGGPVKT